MANYSCSTTKEATTLSLPGIRMSRVLKQMPTSTGIKYFTNPI
jgi:hypothetical protein